MSASGGPSRAGTTWWPLPCPWLCLSLWLPVLLLLLSGGRAARAAPSDSVTVKAACARAAEEGQRLRVRGKLRESLPSFTSCAAQRCPALIRTDCIGWRSEVEAALPTVVVRAVAAQDPTRELYDVEVQVDGELLTRKLDGSALAVNPGEHTFGFRAAGGDLVTQRVVVRVGEKHRLIEATLPAPGVEATTSTSSSATTSSSEAATNKKAGPAAPPPAATVERPPGPPPRRMTTAGWILVGVAGAALASAGYFGITGYLDVQGIRDRGCPPRCTQTEVDAARRRLLIADVSLGAGLAALAGAAWLVLIRPPPAAAAGQPAGSASVGVAPVPGGAVIGVRFGEVRRW